MDIELPPSLRCENHERQGENQAHSEFSSATAFCQCFESKFLIAFVNAGVISSLLC